MIRAVEDLPLVLEGQLPLVPPSPRPRTPLVPTDQRFTPLWVLNIATKACGPIAYDPCTTADNPAGALDFSALPEDGLAQQWAERSGGGLVWVNSPFSRGQLRQWASKACDAFLAGGEVVMLTPVDPSTDWYAILTDHARVAAGLKKRVRFHTPADQVAMESAAKGSTMLWYLGHNTRAFIESARPHAHLYLPGVI